MIPKRSKRFILGSIFVIMLLVGAGNLTAHAQHRTRIITRRPVIIQQYRPYYWGFHYGSPWGWNDPFWNHTVTVVNPIAQQRESGYSDGHKRGQDDAKHNKANDPLSHKHYRDSH